MSTKTSSGQAEFVTTQAAATQPQIARLIIDLSDIVGASLIEEYDRPIGSG
jgi:hypothetical protein